MARCSRDPATISNDLRDAEASRNAYPMRCRGRRAWRSRLVATTIWRLTSLHQRTAHRPKSKWRPRFGTMSRPRPKDASALCVTPAPGLLPMRAESAKASPGCLLLRDCRARPESFARRHDDRPQRCRVDPVPPHDCPGQRIRHQILERRFDSAVRIRFVARWPPARRTSRHRRPVSGSLFERVSEHRSLPIDGRLIGHAHPLSTTPLVASTPRGRTSTRVELYCGILFLL
jgi:hypothetical protein